MRKVMVIGRTNEVDQGLRVYLSIQARELESRGFKLACATRAGSHRSQGGQIIKVAVRPSSAAWKE
jgi:hypothetical protein